MVVIGVIGIMIHRHVVMQMEVVVHIGIGIDVGVSLRWMFWFGRSHEGKWIGIHSDVNIRVGVRGSIFVGN